MDKVDKLCKLFDSEKIAYNDKQISQLIQFYDMTVEKNQYMNLTGITDFDEFCIKHYLDSLQLYRVVNELSISELSLIDVGTGAGFPGIPLKIMYPNLKITLFDSLQKRLSFLDEVIGSLQLTNINTVHGRAEEFGRKPEFRNQFDIVVSRAVAELNSLCELCIPFCKVGGSFISYKGSKGNTEIESAQNAICLLNSKVSSVSEFKLYGDERILVKIDKLSPTPDKYPRAGGKPLKSPL